MKLKVCNYVQFEGQANQWRLDGLTLGPINLLVGKNASGKTRALNVITGLAKLLSGESKLTYVSGNYEVTFERNGSSTQYLLRYENAKIISEVLKNGGRTLLERGVGGSGSIFALKANQHVEFQTPENELAAVARRDSIQHPFFEPLQEWGKSLHRYDFGSSMGRDHLAVLAKEKQIDFDPRDTNKVIGVFRGGEREFGDSFKEAIMKDLAEIGYVVDEIGVRSPTSLIVPPEFPFMGELVGLYVKERSLSAITDQSDM